jgi:Na+/proline symporter
MVSLGWLGAGLFPGLDAEASENVTLVLLRDLLDHVPSLRWIAVLFVAAVLAATMSTIDSALLAISSQLTKNIYPLIRGETGEAAAARLGRRTSIGLMALIVTLAILLREATIWKLIEIKLELLCQVAPGVLLGIHWKRLQARAVISGMFAGTVTSLVLALWAETLFGAARPLGIHAGVWGLGVNLAVLMGLQAMSRTTSVRMS